MDLSYGAEYEAFRAEVRDFLETFGHEAPDAGGDARAWQRRLIEHGYAARTIPKEYGGFGARPDPLKSLIIAEEFSAAGKSTGMSGQGISMLVPTLLEVGSEEQKQRWIAPTLRGEVIWCQGYSEPGAGSDLANLKTAAVDDGEDFIINGQKIWTSTAAQAQMMFILVRTDPDKPKHLGISYVLLPMDTPGIEVRPLKTMTGQAEFNEVFFTDVRVPKANIVGERGAGWAVANATLKHERGMLGDADAAGRRLAEIAAMMTAERWDGTRAADDPILRDRYVRLKARAAAMKFHKLRLLTCGLTGENPGALGLIVKLNGTILNHELAALAIDVGGEDGIAYDRGGDPALRSASEWQWRYMFDLGLIIGGGTSQIQKNIIAERGLGMPREPKMVAQ